MTRRSLFAAVSALAALAGSARAVAQSTAPGDPASASPAIAASVSPDAPGVPGQTATNTPVREPGVATASGAPSASSESPAMPSASAAPGLPTLAALRALIDGFSFGSYGRVVVASDLRGHWGRQANIVGHGTRIDEDTYTELELHRDDEFGTVHTRVVATLAIMGPLFHENGTFATNLAVRNLYVEERGAMLRDLSLWVGSRMYRGDDIYLLNWWPLDNLNTVGGGARYDFGDALTVAAHVGLNRLDSSYQYQQIAVTPRDGIGAAQVVLLDRPRTIGSLKATWWLNGRRALSGIKVSLYGEVHSLPSGIRQNTDSGQLEQLPSDSGYVGGAQVGYYTGVRNTYVNLFFRYGTGLGAYGDLAVPYTLTASQTSQRARDVVLALAGNFERGFFGMLGAAYVRYFRDADAAIYGRNELWEGTVVLRPTIWLGNHAGIALEGSYQTMVFNMLDPVTGMGPRTASEWRFGLIPFVTPAGRGNFTRPHLRAIYAITIRDDGARRLYAPDDPFGQHTLEHFLGLGCEWWFNSSYM